jgi:plastocyanin
LIVPKAILSNESHIAHELRGREGQYHLSIAPIAASVVGSFILATTIVVAPNIANASLGLFSLLSEGVFPTYISRIPPGAAFEGNLFHYYPEDMAIPVGTTVAWFNDDPGQLHTVTSGTPDDEANSGRVFNSGGIPYTSFFQYTFEEAGTFDYYCVIHPWITGSATVSATVEQGQHFEIRSGTGSTLNLSEIDRTMLDFKPITIPALETIPITYNVSLLAPNGQKVFSELFFVLNNDLQVELINNATTNGISVYGPDFSDPLTGTYHIMGNLFETSGEYPIRVEIVAIGNDQPDERMVDVFRMQVTTPPRQFL